MGRKYPSRIVKYEGLIIAQDDHLGGFRDIEGAQKHEIMEQLLHTSVLFIKNRLVLGYEFTERMLKEKRLSGSLADEGCFRRRRALRLLYHLENENEKD